MDRRPIGNSSNVESAGYDQERHVIEVEFRSGAIWEYPADEQTYQGLMLAQSAGRFIHANLIPRGGRRVA